MYLVTKVPLFNLSCAPTDIFSLYCVNLIVTLEMCKPRKFGSQKQEIIKILKDQQGTPESVFSLIKSEHPKKCYQTRYFSQRFLKVVCLCCRQNFWRHSPFILKNNLEKIVRSSKKIFARLSCSSEDFLSLIVSSIQCVRKMFRKSKINSS